MVGDFMTEQDFHVIRKLLLERSAIVLEPGKEYLVESRLAPILRELNLNSIGELIAQLRSQPGNGLHRQIVEAMVTTESSFFRDHHPFEALRKVVIPDLIQRRRDERRLHIWCAASSTGQEPYSLALLIREHFLNWLVGESPSWPATDLSREVLARAREGRYNQIEVNRGLPAALLVKYFDQHGTDWQLQPAIRGMVDFQEINLAQPWPPLPRMDLVLIRNVMIYFDVETKKTILGRLARLLRPDGYLLLGGAETTLNLDDSYRRVEPLKSGFYQVVSASTRLEDEGVRFGQFRKAVDSDEQPLIGEIRELLVEPFIEATRTALRETAGTELDVRAVFQRSMYRPSGNYAAAVDLTSAAVARLVLDFPERTAAGLASRILAGVNQEPDENLIRDCAGEMANVVAGQAKAMLAGGPYQFTFSLPKVLVGAIASTLQQVQDCLVVSFNCDQGEFALQLFLRR